MQIEERDLEFDFVYPPTSQPEWAPRVERWYQLDSASYGLCEFYFQLLRKSERPGFIFLASSEGSLPTDRAFAETGALSPAKFVHTLPNVRASSLCQTMEWFGPIICIQNGEPSFNVGVKEARSFLRRVITREETEFPVVVWVLSLDSKEGKNRVVGKVLSALHNEKESINFSPS